jgi:hypothetical protein
MMVRAPSASTRSIALGPLQPKRVPSQASTIVRRESAERAASANVSLPGVEVSAAVTSCQPEAVRVARMAAKLPVPCSGPSGTPATIQAWSPSTEPAAEMMSAPWVSAGETSS